MTFLYEPRVEVVALTQFRRPYEDSSASWVCDNCATDAEDLIEFAGRACYRSWSNPGKKSNAQYVDHILESQHYSVLEHATVSLWITGVSRSLTHELVRHRHFSYSQESQRFVPAMELNFVVPPAYIGDSILEQGFQADCAVILTRYQETLSYLDAKFSELPDGTLKKKRIREAARAILPNAAETRITVSGNLRSWREFIQKRATEQADAEICRLAVRVFEVLQPLAPAVWQDMALGQDDTGRQVVVPR